MAAFCRNSSIPDPAITDPEEARVHTQSQDSSWGVSSAFYARAVEVKELEFPNGGGISGRHLVSAASVK